MKHSIVYIHSYNPSQRVLCHAYVLLVTRYVKMYMLYIESSNFWFWFGHIACETIFCLCCCYCQHSLANVCTFCRSFVRSFACKHELWIFDRHWNFSVTCFCFFFFDVTYFEMLLHLLCDEHIFVAFATNLSLCLAVSVSLIVHVCVYSVCRALFSNIHAVKWMKFIFHFQFWTRRHTQAK